MKESFLDEVSLKWGFEGWREFGDWPEVWRCRGIDILEKLNSTNTEMRNCVVWMQNTSDGTPMYEGNRGKFNWEILIDGLSPWVLVYLLKLFHSPPTTSWDNNNNFIVTQSNLVLCTISTLEIFSTLILIYLFVPWVLRVNSWFGHLPA